jgi:predicted transcriptional regulator
MRGKPQISRSELEILRYVQDHGPVTARQVSEHFATTRQLARTTVLTLLERLRTKGQLTREKSGNVYLYAPSAPKADVQRALIRDFVERALGGSLSPFVAYLSREAQVTEEELDELKRLVSELDERRGNNRE